MENELRPLIASPLIASYCFPGITDLDQWYSDFVETDWKYVRHYYVEGHIPEWETCRSTGTEIIEPIPIPKLEHREVAVRFAF